MSYTYDEVEAYRQAGSILVFLAALLMFFGGYFSGQLGVKWAGLSALLIAWESFYFLGHQNPEVKMNIYTIIIRIIVSILISLIFWLVFLFGFAMGPGRHWWTFLPLILIYFISAKYIHKPYKRGGGH